MLVTGGAGFIGSHICEKLGGNCMYWDQDDFQLLEDFKENLNLVKCDIRNLKRVEEVLEETQPSVIYHMAAQSFVTVSLKEPRRTHETNYIGTFNLLETVRKLDLDPVIIIACSSAEYGSVASNEIPIKETNPLRPTSPYAVSKVGQDMLGRQYQKLYGLKTIRARFFNISGPRKIGDACSDFAKRIAQIKKGQLDNLKVGNLKAIRDITDVRDLVRALELLKKRGKHGNVYNLCSKQKYKMADIVQKLIKTAGLDIKPQVDEELLRPLDDPIFVGDNSKVKQLGWEPEIPIEKTLEDMFNWWMKHV